MNKIVIWYSYWHVQYENGWWWENGFVFLSCSPYGGLTEFWSFRFNPSGSSNITRGNLKSFPVRWLYFSGLSSSWRMLWVEKLCHQDFIMISSFSSFILWRKEGKNERRGDLIFILSRGQSGVLQRSELTPTEQYWSLEKFLLSFPPSNLSSLQWSF